MALTTAFIPFRKYHGLGNDFIIVNALVEHGGLSEDEERRIQDPAVVRNLCSRRRGIGADGVILLQRSREGCDFSTNIINSDGSIAQMCGNGIRCLGKFIQDLQLIPVNPSSNQDTVTIHTLAGPIKLNFQQNESICVDMGAPRLIPHLIPTSLFGDVFALNAPLPFSEKSLRCSCVSMGNPHCVSVFLFLSIRTNLIQLYKSKPTDPLYSSPTVI